MADTVYSSLRISSWIWWFSLILGMQGEGLEVGGVDLKELESDYDWVYDVKFPNGQ